MTRLSSSWLIAAGAAAVSVGLAGCSPPPPSEEAVLYYLSNARVHGKLRRVWPAGQAYVDAIMKHDAALQKELNLLRRVATPESLWAKADPRWQDQAALEAHVAELERLLDESTPAGEKKPARQELLRAIGEASKQVPEGLSLPTDVAQQDFVRRVWDALAVDGVPLRRYVPELEEVVRARLALYRQVLKGAAGFDSAQVGLRLTDAERQRQIAGRYDALQQALSARREAFIEYARWRLLKLVAFIKGMDKREERWEYEFFSNDCKYLRDALEGIPEALRAECARIDAERRGLESKLKRAGAEQKRLGAQIAFCRKRVEQLGAARDALDTRVKEILQRADALAGESTGTGEK